MEVYAMNLAQQLKDPAEPFLRFFSPERQKQILRFWFAEDRNRTLWTELLVRSVIAKKTSRSMEEISIEREENGKPHVTDSRLQISLSHSKHWAVCSVGNIPSGADVEEASTDALAIAEHFFTAKEFQALRKLDEKSRSKAFLRIWTIKESFVKLTGQSIDECFRTVESAEILSGTGSVTGRNFLLGNAVIGLCTQHGRLLPDTVSIIPLEACRQQAYEQRTS